MMVDARYDFGEAVPESALAPHELKEDGGQ